MMRPTSDRMGWMLVELLLVLTLISLVMSAGLSLIVAVRHTHHAILTDAANGQTLDRLAHEFRRDLQRATSVELMSDSASGGLVLVELNHDHIEYTADDLGVHRIARSGDGTASRDIFLLRGNAQIEWGVMTRDVHSAALGARIDLTMARPGNPLHTRRFQIIGLAPLAGAAEEYVDG